MRRFIAATGLALLLSSGASLATLAQTAVEVGTVVTAEQLENAALNDMDEVRVVDAEPLLAGPRADQLRDAMEASDRAAIRAFLEQETELAGKVREALRDADVAEDDVVGLVVHEEKRLVVLYLSGN